MNNFLSQGVPISWFLLLSAALFSLGVLGFCLLCDDGCGRGGCSRTGHHYCCLSRSRNFGRRPNRPDETMNVNIHLWLIPLLPFAGFLLNGILGSRLPKWLVTTIALLTPLVSFGVVLNAARFVFGIGGAASSLPYIETCPIPWINAGTLHIDFSFVLDQLSLVMLLVVTGVGFLIHIYSVGYMAHEEGYARYFAYLNLFLFFMTVLVLAGNALLMFVGWEGVGLASYLLIGFYFSKDSAAKAGKKAFIVNRIGDFGFLIGIFLLLANFGTLTFSEIASKLVASPAWQGGVLTTIALCLLLGATGKSAQLPLYIWLPDAMEGPTPVSALIHAATMVTAGVYMIARTHVLFDHAPFALGVVAVVGAATALFAATIGLVQNDIKRVLAYSTISQLGYMFLGCGVAAYSAAIFHLVTHAFFKALLFLAAGSDSRDRRRTGSAQDGWPAQASAGHVLDHDRSGVYDRGFSAAGSVLLKGRDPLRGLPAWNVRHGCLVCRTRDGPADFVLHVPPVVHDLYG